MSRTAIVILNYNGEKLLPQFLPSVLQHSTGAEIIVADNASSDQSINILKTNFPQVRIIQLDQNYGFCGGYNRALRQVQADYFVLLNSDVEVTAQWLTPLTQLLDNHPEIAAVQPKILSYHQREKFEHAGAGGGYIDSLGYPFCRGRIFDHIEEDHGQYNDVLPVFWTSGACMMIRSEAFHTFDGFDEDFFAHMEEIDLCWKLHRTSQRVYYCGKSAVFHVGAGTLGYGNPKKVFLNFRNGLSLIYKHFSLREMLYKLPLRFSLDWLAAIIFVMKGQPGSCMAILRAHLAFVKGVGRSRLKRSDIQQKYPLYRRDTIKRGLIVFDYYVRGKKKLH
jgi:GT2 family glycosyltransferase